MTETCLIVGGSHAAAQLAPSLRQKGWQGKIQIVGDETFLPYHRPPLSKSFLKGESSIESIAIRKPEFYVKNDIELRLGQRVEAIRPASRSILLDDGLTLEYSKLALCTGARPRRLKLPGSDLSGVHYLRNLSDVMQIKEQINASSRLVILGGGYIGLEIAAALAGLCQKVTILEKEPRILARVTSAELSEFYTRIHREQGVEINTEVELSRLSGTEKVESVVCADGSQYAADIVLIGVGVIPNTELAEQAGLNTDNGILVDQWCQTSEKDIYAAGDCCSYPNPYFDRRLRLESVPNAIEQAVIAASSICGSPDSSSAKLPWFWSDQYDTKLQIAGIQMGYDQMVIRGNPRQGRSFAIFYCTAGKLIAADCVNRPQEFMASKGLISKGDSVDIGKLSDESFSPMEFLHA